MGRLKCSKCDELQFEGWDRAECYWCGGRVETRGPSGCPIGSTGTAGPAPAKSVREALGNGMTRVTPVCDGCGKPAPNGVSGPHGGVGVYLCARCAP